MANRVGVPCMSEKRKRLDTTKSCLLAQNGFAVFGEGMQLVSYPRFVDEFQPCLG